MKRFVFYKQLNAMDCGPTCLRMIAKFYGRHYNAHTLRKMAGFSKEGVSLLGISDTAEKIGFSVKGVKISLSKLSQVQLPCILHWDKNHFVVLKKIGRKTAEIADPGKGIVRFTIEELKAHWISNKNNSGEGNGIALLLEPMPLFFENKSQKEHKVSWRYVFNYLRSAKWQITQVFIALILGSILQLIFPFLTQSIVDIGVNGKNIKYIVVVLIAQVMLTLSQTILSFIRGRLLLRISNILNIQILSNFWIKLTKLPLSYFDIHQTGDTLQRIDDQKQVQNFLTGTALNTIYSVFNFVIYAVVLVLYSAKVFIIFCIGSIVYFVWIQLFLKIRRKINYDTFHLSANENNATLQLIQGMQEIRLNNAEKQRRFEWESIQVNIFKNNFKVLNYNQLQTAGANFIIQLQGVIISFIVAKFVIDGRLTLGAMLAIQYMLGQLNAPIQQWMGFVQSLQDARISMERLNEIHQLDNEAIEDYRYISTIHGNNIQIQKLSFTYPGFENEAVLKNINLTIPEKKVTAIVGASGSGKTTLIKLLLKIYDEYEGGIFISQQELTNEIASKVPFDGISHSYWRSLCGAVLQDGFIFNDTISRNIAVGVEELDQEKLVQSCQIANIYSYIESLPNGFETKLGSEGTGLSQGQKQRLLIARAVYKNPQFIFFDEATNSLDANNEKQIVENLNKFFNGRTVIIVAHRLSTVRSADKIVVLEGGKIVEEGTHLELTAIKGKYYELVKNQLELGN